METIIWDDFARVQLRVGRIVAAELIEHDMDAVFQLADRITVLVYGKVFAQGTAAQIQHDPRVQAVYLGQEDELEEQAEEGAA